MRHRIAGNKLGRKTSHRKATVRDIAKATLVQQRIITTKAKAKEARKLVDKLITMGKKGTLAHKRRAFAILCDHKLVSQLFNNTSSRFKNRVGGYTRIIPSGTNRRGDNAKMAFLELTEKEEIIVSTPKKTASSKKEAAKLKPTKEEAKPKDTGKEKAVKEEPQAEAVKEKTVEKKEPEAKKVKAEKVQEEKKAPVKKKMDDPQQKKGFLGNVKKMFRRKAT